MPADFDDALSQYLAHEGGIEMLDKSLDDRNIVACGHCFANEGLRLDATALGKQETSGCPRCGVEDGAKLSMRAMGRLAHRYYVQGSVIRGTYGAAPYIMFNSRRKSEIKDPGWPSLDASLFEEILGIGFFHYGPPTWAVGAISPLEELESEDTRDKAIARILREYDTITLTHDDKFYRIRKNLARPLDNDQYDSPPAQCKHHSGGRLDASALPVLYASPDLQTCLHECRVTVEDELFLATLKPAGDLKLLHLAKFLEETDVDPSASLDHAVSMLFLAGPHADPVTRAIALAAREAGYDGLIFPSYFSMLRNGAKPFETAFGLSKRIFPELRGIEQSRFVPNLGIFGNPVREGLVEVSSIDRILLQKVDYFVHFGPAQGDY